MVGGALYTGTLRHRRYRPRPHTFTYDLFMALIDIDNVDVQMATSRWTSCNQFNWASFDDRDHVGGAGRPLRERLAEDAARAGLRLPNGPIYLLTHLRYLGYAFNPISFYYCYDESHTLRAVMNEVNSTFGEQRCYWIDADRAPRVGHGLRHRTAKTLHVSPFMPMDIDWEFVLTEPGESLVAHMNAFQRSEPTDRPQFDATLTLTRRPWTPTEIRRALVRQPVMTAKVIAAIHWEALRLWLKGVPYHDPPTRDAASETHA